jgi:hypothetical protein
VSNTGQFCVLFDERRAARAWVDHFCKWADGHSVLHNLSVRIEPVEEDGRGCALPDHVQDKLGPCVVLGDCDDLQPHHLTEFENYYVGTGLRDWPMLPTSSYVVDSIYESSWERVGP